MHELSEAIRHLGLATGNPITRRLIMEMAGQVRQLEQPPRTMATDVRDFHEKYRQPLGDRPALPDTAALAFRLRLQMEEARELKEAIAEAQSCRPEEADAALAHIAQECVDLIWVTLGTMLTCGIDPAPVWEAVRLANMSKIPNPDPSGKVLKPTGWRAPDVLGAVLKQREPRA